MRGWIVPPPKEPTKSSEAFRKEREEKVNWLIRQGYLRSDRIKEALLRVPREDFIPPLYRDYAYLEAPIPLPGKESTPSPARTVILSFMSLWVWTEAIDFSRLALAQAMALQ